MTDLPANTPHLATRAIDTTDSQDVDCDPQLIKRHSDAQREALAADPTLPKPEEATEAPMLHRISKRSPFGALLSRTLPAYSGPYQVGVCDLEVPVSEPRTFGNFINRQVGMDESGGLLMQTVLFSLFYPADVGDKTPAPVVWFPALRQVSQCLVLHRMHIVGMISEDRAWV